MIRIALTALATLFVITACSENDLRNVPPGEGVGGRIDVMPRELVFDTITANDEDRRTFVVTNVGDANLRVVDFEPIGPSFTLADAPFDFLLEPGQSQTIDVLFRPQGANDQVGQVIVYSEDSVNPEERVDLLGGGIMPQLYIDPPTYDFFADFVGCGDDVEVKLRNVGSDNLVVEGITYSEPTNQLSLVNPLTLPLMLAPGEEASVWVEWNPSIETVAQGALQVLSNDPAGLVTATQRAESIFATVRTDEFSVPVDPPVDILFAVDQSCSMSGTHIPNLSGAFEGLIQGISQVTSGWRIGVATKDDGCFNDVVFTSTTSNLVSRFNTAVNGPSGSNTERLFSVVSAAMSKTYPGMCNQNFIRPNALLHVVVVSDEGEQSSGYSPSMFVGDMQAYKNNNPGLVKISGIVCKPTGCNHSNAPANASGYDTAITLTGGVRLDIESSNWSAYAQQLAAASLTGIHHYQLTGIPSPQSIVVTVDGQQWNSGWHYDATTNEIVFATELPEGATIEVDYGMLVGC